MNIQYELADRDDVDVEEDIGVQVTATNTISVYPRANETLAEATRRTVDEMVQMNPRSFFDHATVESEDVNGGH